MLYHSTHLLRYVVNMRTWWGALPFHLKGVALCFEPIYADVHYIDDVITFRRYPEGVPLILLSMHNTKNTIETDGTYRWIVVIEDTGCVMCTHTNTHTRTQL